jgi:hypothetical protein
MTLIPPADVREPTTVFLLDHGRTSSLVLPDQGGGMVRYGYGDWDYYALRRTGARDAIAALFSPTQGALGRWPLRGPISVESVRRQLRLDIEHLYEIEVECRAVQQLREALERIYRDNMDTLVVTELVEFAFVHHPEPYTAFHNSNHVVADWLRNLGVETRGSACCSAWRIERDES